MAALKSDFFKALLVIFVCSSCSADVEDSSIELLEYASRNIQRATIAYTDRIKHCDQMAESNPTPKLDANKLAALNATRADIATALGYFNFDNYFKCEREARFEFAFYLGAMGFLQKEMKVDFSSIATIQTLSVYPSSREISVAVKYLKLPEPQRKYFESVIGDKPFDLIRALEVNGLMRE